MSHRTLFVAFATLALACSPPRRDDDPPSDTPDAGGPVTNCTPNATVDCTCNDGKAGKATCLADGSRYGVCACGSTLCTPDSTRACVCEGGASGTQACAADGSHFGACECETGNVCAPRGVASCTCTNGASGTKTCADDGSAWGSCLCGGNTCGTHALGPVGIVRAGSTSIDYTGGFVELAAGYRATSDVSASCVNSAHFTLHRADGTCAIDLDFGATEGTDGGLVGAAFDANGCPALGNDRTFQLRRGYVASWFHGAATLPVSGCANASVTFPIATVPLVSSDGQTLNLDLRNLTIAGDFQAIGNTFACVDVACAPGWRAESTFCAPPGCPTGTHPGGLPDSCQPLGSCDSGFVLAGNGDCRAATSCELAPPQAVIGAPSQVSIGTTVRLDGSTSTGPSGLTYLWTLARPSGSAATILGPTGKVAAFTADVAGTYVATLTVASPDGACSASAHQNVVASSTTTTAHKLEVRLTWTNASNGGDLDIHLRGPASARTPSAFFDAPQDPFGANVASDCYWGTCDEGRGDVLDWGLNGTVDADSSTRNDPHLGADDSWGAGPELIHIDQVFDGTFVVGVHYYCSRPTTGSTVGTTSVGAATATVTVLLDGVAQGQPQTRSLTQRDLWEAADVIVSNQGSRVTVVPSTAAVVKRTAQNEGCTADTN